MTARLKTHTLGCKVNQYETEYMREGLLSVGYSDAETDQPADLCIVNTCTVTGEGDAKSRQVIRRMNRQNPDARIIVMGCYATRDPERLADLPGVTEVVTDKRELPDLLGRFGVIDIPTGISSFGNRHRAYVKVQDGCLLRCSYCIIPFVRPKMYSRPAHEIVDEVRRLVQNGYREIVLTGIHLGHYGVDWNVHKPKSEWVRLSHLMKRLVAIDGEFRIRLSSIEATEVTRELIEVIGENSDRVCPHLHICLQSGAESVLQRMNRRWGVKRFVDRCHLVQELLDRPGLTTDVIVGFPGESEREFQETCDTVRSCGFSKVHVFPFSARRGTPAAELPNQLDKRLKSERVARIAEVEAATRHKFFASLCGTELQLLTESPCKSTPGHVVGTSARYAPVRFSPPKDLADADNGYLVRVAARRIEDGVICADPV